MCWQCRKIYFIVGRHTCCYGHDGTFKKKREFTGISVRDKSFVPQEGLHLAETENGCRVRLERDRLPVILGQPVNTCFFILD
jgi:hypothetical protein